MKPWDCEVLKIFQMLKVNVSSESNWKICEMQGQCSCFKAFLLGTLQEAGAQDASGHVLLALAEGQPVLYRDFQSSCVWPSLYFYTGH